MAPRGPVSERWPEWYRLAVELAVQIRKTNRPLTFVLAAAFIVVTAFFAYWSFYSLRIESGVQLPTRERRPAWKSSLRRP